MPVIDLYLADFVKRIDPKARPIRMLSGEDGPNGRVLFNAEENIFYYLYYMRVWFNTFYRFGTPDDGPGCGVHKQHLEEAAAIDSTCFIIICYKELESLPHRWFALDAKVFNNYAKKYDTYFKDANRYTQNGHVPVSFFKELT